MARAIPAAAFMSLFAAEGVLSLFDHDLNFHWAHGTSFGIRQILNLAAPAFEIVNGIILCCEAAQVDHHKHQTHLVERSVVAILLGNGEINAQLVEFNANRLQRLSNGKIDCCHSVSQGICQGFHLDDGHLVEDRFTGISLD
jgi:hypothetical protein